MNIMNHINPLLWTPMQILPKEIPRRVQARVAILQLAQTVSVNLVAASNRSYGSSQHFSL